MEKSTSQKVKLGIFVTTGFIFLTIGVYFVGEKQNLFSSNFELRTIFKNVGGLQAGHNVRFSGINVGTVEELILLNDSTIEVVMMIEDRVKPFIRKDAITAIGSDGLVGSMLVNISPGPGRLPGVEDGDLLQSVKRVSTEAMMGTLSDTNDKVAILIDDLLKITSNITEGQGVVSMLLYDSLLVGDVKQAIANLESTTNYVNRVALELQNVTKSMDREDNLMALLTKDTALSANIQQTVGNLESSSENLVSITDQMAQVLAKLDDDEGTVGALLNDEEMADDLRTTIHNLSVGSAMLNENMEAMRHNFLFKKYFKKQEKNAQKPDEDMVTANE